MKIYKSAIDTILAGSVLFLWIVLLLPGTAFSAVAYDLLEPLTQGLSFPEDVAVSGGGTVVVADPGKKLVLIYDAAGELVAGVRAGTPVSVAAKDDTYFVGQAGGNVTIHNSSGQVIGSLGQGAQEFLYPQNMAIDQASGNIYVVDSLAQSIKSYAADGSFIAAVDDSPNNPLDIAIVGGEMYVLELPTLSGDYGGTGQGARVQVYDLAGNPLRSFGSYGMEAGQLIKPKGLTVDEHGVVYISEGFHKVILCFNGVTGTYLGDIRNSTQTTQTPLGLSMGSDGRLFVASSFAHLVQVFGISSAGYEGDGGGGGETVYEDGEDSLIAGWDIYDNDPAGTSIENVFDADLQSQVIRLTGSGLGNGYRLRKTDGSKWANTNQFVIQWRMQYAEDFYLYVDIETSAGHRYLTYRPVDASTFGAGEYIYFGLGSGLADGQWQTVVRDLQADLTAAQPGVTIGEVNGILVRGSGKLDDIKLMASVPAGLDSDGDGITDVDELQLYGTDPRRADSDSDGINDGTELSYWLTDWNKDFDGDGLINLLDTDADGDGIPDGEEIDKGYHPGDSTSVPLNTVYGNAETGLMEGWSVYDADPVGASVSIGNDVDHGQVVELNGSGLLNGYRLRNKNGSKWHNASQFVIQWSMKYSEDFYVYVDVETSAGHRYLTYRSVDYDSLGAGEYVYYGLGGGIVDGRWHTVVRDLQVDLAAAQPGVRIREVNSFLVRGSGLLDDIQLLQTKPAAPSVTVLEDGLLGGNAWDVYDNDPVGASVASVFDDLLQSDVVELTGSGLSNGYRLRDAYGQKLHNTSQFVVEWSLRFSEDFYIYVDIETSAGHRYLTYRPVALDALGSGENVYHGLGSNMTDGLWHLVSRDLQADLAEAQPGVSILEVNGFLVRGNGRLDDIRLKQ